MVTAITLLYFYPSKAKDDIQMLFVTRISRVNHLVIIFYYLAAKFQVPLALDEVGVHLLLEMYRYS